VATLLHASPSRVQPLAPLRGGHAFTLKDFAKLLHGDGAIRVCRVQPIEPPHMFEVLVVRDTGPGTPLNMLATAILAAARLPIVDPIRGDAVHCSHVTAGHPDDGVFT
jgi:hypothetical protein